MVEEIQKIINKFDGGAATLWHFIPKNDRLVLRIQASEKYDVIYVLLVFCLEISAPMKWIIHQPEIKKISEHEYQFKDKNSRILFRECQIQTDYDKAAQIPL